MAKGKFNMGGGMPTNMAHLMKHYRKEELTPEARYAHDQHLALLDRVKAYIAKNHRRHISTEELAGICFFSIEYFCRFFKKHMNQSPLEYIKTVKSKSMVELLDLSQSENLGRTLITTITTMLAVASLYIFASGGIKDFALALLVGMVSGVYSTIFIAGAFVSVTRKNWKPSDEEKKSQTKNIVDMDAEFRS